MAAEHSSIAELERRFRANEARWLALAPDPDANLSAEELQTARACAEERDRILRTLERMPIGNAGDARAAMAMALRTIDPNGEGEREHRCLRAVLRWLENRAAG